MLRLFQVRQLESELQGYRNREASNAAINEDKHLLRAEMDTLRTEVAGLKDALGRQVHDFAQQRDHWGEDMNRVSVSPSNAWMSA